MKVQIEKCVVFHDNRSTPSITEKGKTFQIDNSKSKVKVKCIKVDNCVFDGKDGIKCDYLFEVESAKKIFYVELKGSDVIHAIEQIHSTVLKTREYYKGWIWEARIVLGKRVPEVKNRKEYEQLYGLIKPSGRVIIKHLDLYNEPHNIWSTIQ